MVACGQQPIATPAPATAQAITNTPSTPVTIFSTVCATCHGLHGEGNSTLKTPSIAGLPQWYVTQQLEKFQNHQRGTHQQDVTGQQMHAIAMTLSPETKTAVAKTIEALSPFPTTNTLGGNSEKGKNIYAFNCIDCHRYNGSGELAFHSAPLTGLQDWYLLSQLIKFRDGIRGHNPNDEDGAKMHEQTGGLTNEQFRDLVAYIATLAKRYPPGQ